MKKIRLNNIGGVFEEEFLSDTSFMLSIPVKKGEITTLKSKNPSLKIKSYNRINGKDVYHLSFPGPINNSYSFLSRNLDLKKEKRYLTWNEVRKEYSKVTVESYGYIERNLFNYHFEPFKNKRKFVFNVESDGLYHSWLILDENLFELSFELRDGKVYLDDPNLTT